MRRTEQPSCDDIPDMLPTDGHVYDWLVKERWGGDPKCPRGGGGKPYRRTGDRARQMTCRHCRKKFNVKTGAIFQGTRGRLRAWFRSAAQLPASRMGIFSLEIGAIFRLRQGMTWSLPRKVREGFEFRGGPLKEVARLDETHVGGLGKNKHADKKTPGNQGGSLKTRIAVAGLYEEPAPGRLARFLAWTMLSAAREKLQEALAKSVDPGACIAGDMASRHHGISSHMVNHRAGEYVRGSASTNGVESMWAIVKRMRKGVHVKFSPRRLGRYLKEAEFRLNEFHRGSCVLCALSVIAQGAFRNRLAQRQLASEGIRRHPALAC